MKFDAYDIDRNQVLDFREFCALVRDREGRNQTDENLRARFDALDPLGKGMVDVRACKYRAAHTQGTPSSAPNILNLRV